MKLRALAKINLGLDVVRKREDGYHEVRMIMQNINMYDQLEFQITKEPGIHLSTNLPYIPTNEGNHVYKTVKMLIDEFSIEQGVDINLTKVIPVAAGLAGGSSDAAAAFIAMNYLFKLGLSTQELMKRGVKVGADVPYCIMRGTALAEGIGEKLTALDPMPPCFILIAKPGINVSTKEVYEALDANHLKHHPDIDGMLLAMKEENLSKLASLMENVLETVTAVKYPEIEKIKKIMKEAGALNAMMSGSGPTVFGIFEKEGAARQAMKQLKMENLAKNLFLTKPFYQNISKVPGGRNNDQRISD